MSPGQDANCRNGQWVQFLLAEGALDGASRGRRWCLVFFLAGHVEPPLNGLGVTETIVSKSRIALKLRRNEKAFDVWFANMPVGSLHSFNNESGKPAKMLISVASAGLEQMFFGVGQPVSPGAAVPLPTKAVIEKLLTVAPRYGIEIRVPGHR